jgi:twinkle protein
MESDVIREAISEANLSGGQARVRCPMCSHERKKRNEKTLSLTVEGDSILYKCHHCDAGGGLAASRGLPELRTWDKQPPTSSESIFSGEDTVEDTVEETPRPAEVNPLSPGQVDWFQTRGISPETLGRCGVTSGDVYISARSKKVPCVGFPYVNKDGSRATKWRDGGGRWTQTGSARSLLRVDEFTGGDLVITEGEMDMLSMEEVGVTCTSVPNGAPSGPVKSLSAKKFSYLWDAKKKIDAADRVILATDNDGPGVALEEEIARRIGKARCWRVEYPEDCKDANDVLVKHGRERLLQCVGEATPWPVSGLRDVSEYRSDVMSLFQSGFDVGVSSGVASLDRIYKAMPQSLTVITGIPGSGKSTFLTWLSVQIASREGWNCAVLSAETSAQVQILQLSSVYVGKPFRGPARMSEDELNLGMDWVAKRFVFLDEADTNIDSVLERAQAAVWRNGIRLLIIDPYNFLTTSSPVDDSGVSGINRLLIALKSFAVEHGIAIFLVAHPTKLYRDQSGNVPVASGYDVAGSAGFYNVCDAGYTVTRSGEGEATVSVWKVRFPWIGELGEVVLDYDIESGSFSELTMGGTGGEVGGGQEEIDFDFD